MSIRPAISLTVLLTLCLVPCTLAQNKPPQMLKLSKYDHAGYCSLAVAPDGVLHAVFSDQPDYSKPAYLYYRTSRDNGATWSDPQTLSDDESGNAAGYGRLLFDGKGRAYAIWKYTDKNALLDGPGGNAPGILAFRCLEAGTWSKTVKYNTAKSPMYSWFAAPGPDGAIHLYWSQMAADALAMQGWGASSYADQVLGLTLDGPAAGEPKAIVGPKPLPTADQIKAAKAAGHPIPYADERPKKDGLINLRGYVDKQGNPHFIAEDPGLTDGPTPQQTGKRIMHFDGAKLQPVYAFERFQTYNTFNNPPALLVDANGKEHVIRAPEKSETATVRDYTIEDGKLADPTDIVGPKDAKGVILHWQAIQLPEGRMAVTASVNEKGGMAREGTELYLSIFDGKGKWSAPRCVTDNAAREAFAHKETTPGSSVSTLNNYRPDFADVALSKDGHPCVLMVNCENTILGLTSPGVTSSGRVVSVTGVGSVDSPMVFFLRLD